MRLLVSGSTRTVRRLAVDWPDRLGVLLTPANRNSLAGVLNIGLPWAIDNGAFSGFDPVAFRRLLRKAVGQDRCLFIVAPDVVGDARQTLDLWNRWCVELTDTRQPAAYVLQDGQETLPLPDAEAYFVGGSTRFKLSRAAADLVRECKEGGAYIHMGRVNSLTRLRVAYDWGCDSVDGSGYSRFAAVARLKGRADMLLERHLRFVRGLEAAAAAQGCLFR
jgi:hypothetical protein